MLTRRTLWQVLTGIFLVKPATAANEGPAPTPSTAMPSPTGGPGMEMLTIFFAPR